MRVTGQLTTTTSEGNRAGSPLELARWDGHRKVHAGGCPPKGPECRVLCRGGREAVGVGTPTNAGLETPGAAATEQT